jgi:hypothetical protein
MLRKFTTIARILMPEIGRPQRREVTSMNQRDYLFLLVKNFKIIWERRYIMKKSKTKLKVVKLDDKRPLGDDEQINLVTEKMYDLFDDIQYKVTIPNTIIAVQLLVTDLAFDTAPSNTVASSMLLDIINHRLRHEVEKEHEDD